MSSDAICTSDQNTPSKHCLTRGDSIGLTIVAEAGLLSLVAILYVFGIIARNIFWRFRHVSIDKLRIFHQPMDLLMFSLFFADALQAIGAVLDLKWINDGRVEVGGFCNAQGIIQNVGETGVAMTTLLIAVFTFLGVWMGRGITSMWLTRVVLGCIWLFIAIMVIVGNTVNQDPTKSHFQSPTPYWCWISKDYMVWRIFGEYLWFWITLGFSFLVYIPLYLWIRGNIVIHDPSWWSFHFQHADKSDPELRARRRHSIIMAVYPLVYCFNILPLSVVRWIGFQQEAKNNGVNSIPAAATFAVTTIYGLSGLLNVVLLLTTKPESGLFGTLMHVTSARPPSPLLAQETEDVENHATHERKQSVEEEYSLGRLPSRS